MSRFRLRRGWFAGQPIVTRLVVAMAAAMAAVLLVASAVVYWRVSYALGAQLDQDLAAYQRFVKRTVAHGAKPPANTPGEHYQVYDPTGLHVLASDSSHTRLVSPDEVRAAAAGVAQHLDVGELFPTDRDTYRAVVQRVHTSKGTVVVAAAISRTNHDEALRELLFQLLIAGLLTLAGASFVGYRTARAALDPVEGYRVAAAGSGDDPSLRLPVAEGRDDELSRLGATFNDLLARIEAAGRRERQFLADASHELRSPLSLMRAELDYVLARDRSSDDMRTALVSLREQVKRLVELANALLDLEELRAEGGLMLAPVLLTELVEEVTDRYRGAFTREGRELHVEVEDRVVRGSRRWLELAVDNLVSNALRHGAGAVDVRGCVIDGQVRISVTDQGSGFPDDFARVAFERFTRAEKSRSTGGSGLGLALVQAVADAHDGRAWLEGTTVQVEVPARA